MEQQQRKDLTLTQPSSISLTTAVAISKPVKQLLNEGLSVQSVVQQVSLRISKYASMLHIGGSLLPHEPVTIAQMLIDEYPTASIEDFDLMLKRGIMGRYSEKTLGFDVSVIFGWMQKFMEEWAEEKERQLTKEKNKLAESIEPAKGDWSPETEKLVREFQEMLRGGNVKSVPILSQEEIRKEGQSTPPKRKGHAKPRPEWLVGDPCEDCQGSCCKKCNGTGKVNAILVHADNEHEAFKAYKYWKEGI